MKNIIKFMGKKERDRKVCLCMTFFLLALPVFLFGEKDLKPGIDTIVPDPKIQSMINNYTYNIATDEDFRKALEEFKGIGGENYEKLIPQILYYTSKAKSTREGMMPATLFEQLKINDFQSINAIMPYLGTKDNELKEQLYNFLGGIDGTQFRVYDFSLYNHLILKQKLKNLDPPHDLIAYMYQRSPGTAVISIQKVYHNDPNAMNWKPIYWAEHLVSDVLWKQKWGFLQENEVEQAALDALDVLSQHKGWWARLYVANILKQEPEFRTEKMVERLKADKHHRVRRMIDFEFKK